MPRAGESGSSSSSLLEGSDMGWCWWGPVPWGGEWMGLRGSQEEGKKPTARLFPSHAIRQAANGRLSVCLTFTRFVVVQGW